MLNIDNHQTTGKQREGNIIGFDFGQRRIGVAIGNNVSKTAQALITIESATNNQKFEAIQKIMEEWMPVSIVVGVPFNVDGSEIDVKKKKLLIDQIAAKIILQSYLDQI